MSLTLQHLNGETALIALLGDPVKQVRSPGPLTQRMQDAGMNVVQMPFHVMPADLAEFIATTKKVSNVAGYVLTVPHKLAAMQSADRLTYVARLAGSINLLRREQDGRWLGHNVDGFGLVAGLIADGNPPAGKVVFVAGAGGAGCGGCAALADAGVKALQIYDPSAQRTQLLATRIREYFPSVTVEALSEPDPSRADIAVNATPLGMMPDDPLPFEVSRLRRDAVVAEFVMKPAVTRLLELARAAGHRVSLGENVLNYQLAETIAFMGGVSPISQSVAASTAAEPDSASCSK